MGLSERAQTSLSLTNLPPTDSNLENVDLEATLPATLSGNVISRVIDTDRAAGHQAIDTVNLDEFSCAVCRETVDDRCRDGC